MHTQQGAAAMTPGVEAFVAKYIWIWVGLTFGFAAKYAMLIKRGITPSPRLIIADVMILPMVALIAYSLVRQAGIDAEAAALLTAFVTVCADRVIKLYTERFLRQVEAVTLRDVARDVIESSGELRQAVQKVDSAKAVASRPAPPADQ
ncbi:hypothetical protein [Sphingobium yanoikuyae]|uniref:hypothetical protein n=1 Tax=Sphingobium yanoikuyae TaxID=13690 RepID=UPI0028A9B77C|nr:hypothetical protein [Sphingobium yanoikuyae]